MFASRGVLCGYGETINIIRSTVPASASRTRNEMLCSLESGIVTLSASFIQTAVDG